MIRSKKIAKEKMIPITTTIRSAAVRVCMCICVVCVLVCMFMCMCVCVCKSMDMRTNLVRMSEACMPEYSVIGKLGG